MSQIVTPGVLKGLVVAPPSKSDAQRAIIAAFLANGKTIIYNIGQSEDVQNVLNAVENLGAKITQIDSTTIEIQGGQLNISQQIVSVGESGLGARLLIAICASFSEKITLTGHGTLMTRPMDFYETYLPNLGVEISTTNGKLPVSIKGPLNGSSFKTDGSVSSQYISGLLMSLPLSKQNSVMEVENQQSTPYIQMTLQTLGAFGIKIQQVGTKYLIPGKQRYQATAYHVENDWSAASYWLLAAALGHPIQISGLNTTSLQADKAFLDVLKLAGCCISVNESILEVSSSSLRAFTFDATHCPDLFPTLVVLAAKIKGISIIKGLNRLQHKESDRGKVLRKEFGKMGLNCELIGDEMHVHGTGVLHGARVFSHKDHRIAMSLAIAATCALGTTIIEDAQAVSKSYPEFWEQLKQLKSN